MWKWLFLNACMYVHVSIGMFEDKKKKKKQNKTKQNKIR